MSTILVDLFRSPEPFDGLIPMASTSCLVLDSYHVVPLKGDGQEAGWDTEGMYSGLPAGGGDIPWSLGR